VFIGEKLIYLQLPKTGCTHIAALLAETIEGEQIKKHNILTEYEKGKKIIGSVRNPWSWYVSLWAYGCEGKGDIYPMLAKKSVYRVVRKLYRQGIAEAFYEAVKPTGTWREAYSDSNDPTCFQKWLKKMYAPRTRFSLPKDYHEYNLSEFAGYYTHRYALLHLRNYYKKDVRKMISSYNDLFEYDRENSILDHVIRTESIEEDLVNVLRLCGYDSPEIERRIVGSRGSKTNKSQHMGTGFYYNEETIQLVAERERLIVEKYGYEPPEIVN